MTSVAYFFLRQVYYQHGLISFLLLFVPVIPGFVESHTRTYIRLLRLFAGDYHDAQEAVRIIFGRRGLATYQDYIARHPAIIRPGQIYRRLYQQADTPGALTLLSTLLLNPHQRAHPFSDRYRQAICQELPYLLQYLAFTPHPAHRDALVSLFLSAYERETSPETKSIMTSTLHQIYHLASAAQRRHQTKHAHRHQFQLEAQLKACLTPATSIYSMTLLTVPPPTPAPDHPWLSQALFSRLEPLAHLTPPPGFADNRAHVLYRNQED